MEGNGERTSFHDSESSNGKQPFEFVDAVVTRYIDVHRTYTWIF